MLFWIILILTIVCIIWGIKTADSWNISGLIMAVVMSIVFLISLGIFICIHISADGIIAADKARYEMLVYQYENDIYDNDNDLGKRDLMMDIQDWNEDLAYYKKMQHNFWIGIYIPDVFDEFEYIELKKE